MALNGSSGYYSMAMVENVEFICVWSAMKPMFFFTSLEWTSKTSLSPLCLVFYPSHCLTSVRQFAPIPQPAEAIVPEKNMVR
jgi:hypothetical protein